MTKRRIAVVTGSRSEYGLLYWPMHDIAADPNLELALIVTGSHLESRYGRTVDAIEADGLAITRRVPIGLDDDSPAGVAASMGQCLSGMIEALSAIAPDLLLLLGDRYEALAAAQAALLLNLPIAHVAGGDITEGAIDDAIRHAITKLAHIHFPTNAESANRIVQMGEGPERVHVTGSPGLDHLVRTKRLDRPALEEALGHPLGVRNILVTFHPVTLDADGGRGGLDAMLTALDDFGPDTSIWVSRPNADPGGQLIAARLDEWAAGRTNVHVYDSLGQQRYLSLLGVADMMIGNSSSALYEAPSFGLAAVNIGHRQRGRLSAPSVFDCSGEAEAIRAAISVALRFDRAHAFNPYGDGHASGRIVAALKAAPSRAALLHKTFHRIKGNAS